jgi:hypothetical protein
MSNCPLGNETANIIAFLTRLSPGYGHPYFDWMIHTRLGDAHFIAVAPNAWDDTQQAWFVDALAENATYTFVIVHEPPDAYQPPTSTDTIEQMIAARSRRVTLRLYGHTHEYHHLNSGAYNAVVNGNAGAPLGGNDTSGQYYGFGVVQQRADGNIVFTAYQVGSPAMPLDSWVVTPEGLRTQ